jgi:acyl carrier protein
MPELLTILQDFYPDIDFHTHTRLIDGKVMDSFSLISLIGEINDKLDIAIPAEEIVPENFNSYAALSALLTRLSDD